jgi:hypothetical protein
MIDPGGYIKDDFRSVPGALISTRKFLDGLEPKSRTLIEYFCAAGLEAQLLNPVSVFDPVQIVSGPQVYLKNLSKKLVVIPHDATPMGPNVFLEPGETTTLAYSPELRAAALNNGV